MGSSTTRSLKTSSKQQISSARVESSSNHKEWEQHDPKTNLRPVSTGGKRTPWSQHLVSSKDWPNIKKAEALQSLHLPNRGWTASDGLHVEGSSLPLLAGWQKRVTEDLLINLISWKKSGQPKTTSRHFLDRRAHDYNIPQSHWTLADEPKVGIKALNSNQVFQLYAAVRDHNTVIKVALLQ